jgi:cytochrome c oxidase cbb3-type subunit IV
MGLEEFLADARSVVTVASLLAFIGIVWWSYSARRAGMFEEAANLPFADGDDAAGLPDMGARHG